MKHHFGIVILLVLLGFAPGCAQIWSHEPLNYRTVSTDPSHDTERAKKENEKALKLIADGNLDKAEQSLQRSLIADVDFGPAHNNLGKLYYNQAKYYLAAWEFDHATKAMPDHAEPLNNLGLVYEKVGKLNEAIEAYETAQRMQPTNPEMLGNLARARIRRGDPFSEVEKPLKDLVFYDTRPEWVDWAKQQLALSNKSDSSLPAAEPIQTPRGEPTPHASDEMHFFEEDPTSSPHSLPAKGDPDRTTRRLAVDVELK